MMVLKSTRDDANNGHVEAWPREVDLIISALEAAQGQGLNERRGTTRTSYRTQAELKLFSDRDGNDPWVLYTRDMDSRGVGFITRHRLPLGYGGLVRFVLPDGSELEANCTLLRCREAAPGWFEGALSFNREQAIGTW